MIQQEFEDLVAAAGLNLLSKYAPRFVVSLYAPTVLVFENGSVLTSTRVQCDLLSYETAEFAMLTPEQARQQIEACKKRLQRAAKTKQGVLR